MFITMLESNKTIVKELVKYAIYLLIVLGLTLLAFYLTIGNNASKILDTLGQANVYYILGILGIVIMCFILRSIVIFVLMRSYQNKYPFHRAIAIDQVGTLYRMVTPAGLGSHIMETYTFKKQKISISTALSVLAMYSILYQVVLIIYNTITLIIKAPLVASIGSIAISFSNESLVNVPLWILIAIGYIANVSVIFFIFLISYWNGFYRFLDYRIGKLLVKVHIIKDEEKYHDKLLKAKDNFRSNLKHLLTNVPTLIIAILAFTAYITISYSTPYFAGLSLGNTSAYANFWDSVLLSNFHQMVTCIIPIPGSSLLSELFFLRIFYPSNAEVSFYSSEEIARSSLLLWRSLMFIFPLFISSIFTMIYRPRKEDIYGED